MGDEQGDEGRIDSADDEENLRKHAARGAQAAIVAARDKARAFDEAMPGAKKKAEEAMPIDRKSSLLANPLPTSRMIWRS